MTNAILGLQKHFKLSEKWIILKNILVISVAFTVHFAAYNGTANLQSSINAEAGLGTASLAAIYAGLIFSNVFLTSAVIKWLGIKWTICLSFTTYMPYIAVQLHPTFYTMIPAGIIVGLGAAPLWCAKCTYLSMVSQAYSKIIKVPSEILLTRFLSLFFTVYSTNLIWGNLISSVVISSGGNEAAVTSVNASLIPELCGVNFLPSADAGKALQHQPQEKIQMLVGIFLACMAAAVLIVALGTDSLNRFESARQTTSLSGFALLAVTAKLLSEPNQLLLTVLTVFTGFQHAFFSSDVMAAYVSCSIGTGTVGFIMMTYGVADMITCAITACLTKFTGRLPIVTFAGVVHAAMLVTLLSWRPQAHSGYVLYVIAYLWGSCNGIWVVQMNAYPGCLFPGREEAAYSNFRVWDSAGFIIAYIISSHVRTRDKIYFQLAMLAVGLICYYVIEWREWRKMKHLGEEKKKEGCENDGFTIAE